jgi:pyridoxine 5-phosphate synthase
MSRLAVDIDSVAVIRNLFMDNVPDPAHLLVLAELGGAESIVCNFREDMKSVNDRDISIMREIVKSHLNIRSTINGESVRKLLKIKPDMITFVSLGEKNLLEAMPVNTHSHADILSSLTADLRANDITTSLLIDPDINEIKLAAKLEFDYVELYAMNYTTAEDLDQQIAELENLNSMIIAANRLGMGVNISGGINHENISDLAKLSFLEDLIVGKSLIVKALAIGFEQAVRDFINILYK